MLLDVMNDVISAGDKNGRTIQFEWFLTNWCNYSCTYCSEASNMSDKFAAGKYKLALARLNSVDTPFTVELIGGEPTLHPNFIDIVDALCSNQYCMGVEVVTNLSRPIGVYHKLQNSKVGILASFHPEHYNEEFVGKLSALNNVKLAINLTDDPTYWDVTDELIRSVDDIGVEYTFNILSPTSTYVPNYTSAFYDRFGDRISGNKHNMRVEYVYESGHEILNESDIFKRRLNRFKGYSCTPLRYRITHDGDIMNFCTNKQQPIKMTANTLIQRIVCPVDCCRCDALFAFHKERI